MHTFFTLMIWEYNYSYRPCYLSSSVPSTPTAVSVSEATGSSVRVTWTTPPGNTTVLGYLVSFERLAGRGCVSLHNDTDGVNSMTTDYTILGLSGLSTYMFSVVAVSISGSSGVVTSNTIDTLQARESCVYLSLSYSV